MKKGSIEKLAWFRFYQSPSKKNSWYRIAHRYLTKQISIEIHADVVAAKRNGPWGMKRDLKKVSMSGWIMMSSIFLCCIPLSQSLSHALFLLLPADATKICRNGSFSGGKIETRLVWGGKRLCDKSGGSASASHFPGNSSCNRLFVVRESVSQNVSKWE